MRSRIAFVPGVVVSLCLAAPVRAAVVSYRAVLDPDCTYCAGGDLPGTGLFEATWDDSTFDLDYTLSYSGLTSNLQAIRFLDRVTGANFNGPLGPLPPESGEEFEGLGVAPCSGPATFRSWPRTGTWTSASPR